MSRNDLIFSTLPADDRFASRYRASIGMGVIGEIVFSESIGRWMFTTEPQLAGLFHHAEVLDRFRKHLAKQPKE